MTLNVVALLHLLVLFAHYQSFVMQRPGMALFINFVTGYTILLANLLYNSCLVIDTKLILQAITPIGAVLWYAYQGTSDQVGLR